jgi:hypothetical protein
VQIVHRQLLAVKGLDRVGLLDVAFEQVLVHVFEGAFVAVHVHAHDELEMAIYVGQDNAWVARCQWLKPSCIFSV